MNIFQKIFFLPILAMLLVGGFADVYLQARKMRSMLQGRCWRQRCWMLRVLSGSCFDGEGGEGDEKSAVGALF